MRCDHANPRGVLRVAYDAARRAFPAHRHKFSPKKFTQLLACLVLKEFARLDYRGLADHLADYPDLAREIDLEAAPTSPPSRRPRRGF